MILIVGGAFQGQLEFAKETLKIKEEKILTDFHLLVKSWMKEDNDIEKEIENILSKGYDAIISDEVGMGIVPLDRQDREYREMTGRLLCSLAKEATAVYRVNCGLGMKIK